MFSSINGLYTRIQIYLAQDESSGRTLGFGWGALISLGIKNGLARQQLFQRSSEYRTRYPGIPGTLVYDNGVYCCMLFRVVYI